MQAPSASAGKEDSGAGVQSGLCPGPEGLLGGQEEEGLPPTAADARPRRGGRRWLGELAPGGCRAGVLGGASLVEEVGLEGGGQRQRVDLAQTLLPQGQAHRAAAQVHERQRLRWGKREESAWLARLGLARPQALTTGEQP